MTASTAAETRESEQELVARAQESVSQCNWVVGECAAIWTRKYARGRTDADFAGMVGLSSDQVYQRRRVWETFSDVRSEYPSLKWSHFYVAINWDDAPECLQWSDENQATVSEMKAWRRARNGEDLTTPPPADDWGGDPAVAFVPSSQTAVRDPEAFEGEGREGEPRERSGERQGVETQSAFAREAGAPASEDRSESRASSAERPEPSVEQVVQRMISQLERVNNAFTPEFREQFRNLPGKVRGRFVKAVSELGSKVAELG